MNRKNLLIILLAVGLAAMIGYGLYLQLGPPEMTSQGEQRPSQNVSGRQASSGSQVEQEVGQPVEDVRPQEESVASGPSVQRAVSPEAESNPQQSPESLTDSQPAPVISVSSVESQVPEKNSEDFPPSRVENPDAVADRDRPAEARPQPTAQERRTVVASETEPTGDTRIAVQRSAIALSVENREPKGVCERVSVREGRVYCWVHVINGAGRKIIVRWIKKGKKLWETPLPVGSNSWRTWAYITLRPSMVGPARVEILNEDGEVLQAESFEITV
jgi:cytoskeletal protein RodZ